MKKAFFWVVFSLLQSCPKLKTGQIGLIKRELRAVVALDSLVRSMGKARLQAQWMAYERRFFDTDHVAILQNCMQQVGLGIKGFSFVDQAALLKRNNYLVCKIAHIRFAEIPLSKVRELITELLPHIIGHIDHCRLAFSMHALHGMIEQGLYKEDEEAFIFGLNDVYNHLKNTGNLHHTAYRHAAVKIYCALRDVTDSELLLKVLKQPLEGIFCLDIMKGFERQQGSKRMSVVGDE